MKLYIEILACVGGACLIASMIMVLGFLVRDIKDRKAKRKEQEERCQKCHEHWNDTEEEEKK